MNLILHKPSRIPISYFTLTQYLAMKATLSTPSHRVSIHIGNVAVQRHHVGACFHHLHAAMAAACFSSLSGVGLIEISLRVFQGHDHPRPVLI